MHGEFHRNAHGAMFWRLMLLLCSLVVIMHQLVQLPVAAAADTQQLVAQASASASGPLGTVRTWSTAQSAGAQTGADDGPTATATAKATTSAGGTATAASMATTNGDLACNCNVQSAMQISDFLDRCAVATAVPGETCLCACNFNSITSALDSLTRAALSLSEAIQASGRGGTKRLLEEGASPVAGGSGTMRGQQLPQSGPLSQVGDMETHTEGDSADVTPIPTLLPTPELRAGAAESH